MFNPTETKKERSSHKAGKRFSAAHRVPISPQRSRSHQRSPVRSSFLQPSFAAILAIGVVPLTRSAVPRQRGEDEH